MFILSQDSHLKNQAPISIMQEARAQNCYVSSCILRKALDIPGPYLRYFHSWGISIHNSTQVMWGYLLASVKPWVSPLKPPKPRFNRWKWAPNPTEIPNVLVSCPCLKVKKKFRWKGAEGISMNKCLRTETWHYLILSEFIEEQWKANPHDACICSGIDQTSRSTKIQRKTVQECFSHWIYAYGWSIIARSLQSVSWVFFLHLSLFILD